jgi:prophage regulatory protein
MSNTTPFLRDIEVAIRYNISRSTIWRWVKNGRFPKPIKLGVGSTRWRFSDLETWEQSQIQDSPDKGEKHA